VYSGVAEIVSLINTTNGNSTNFKRYKIGLEIVVFQEKIQSEMSTTLE